ncbi:MAG: phosphoribosylglycinamide formyltransferase [Flavobacteriales bacterium]|nr:phosphoribosylglycinamide formyltransferase [Flavobacteriales bacterium]
MKLAIFASGTGTNAARIIEYFRTNNKIFVELVITNRERAGVVNVARSSHVNIEVVPRSTFIENPDSVLSLLEEKGIGFIVLAGFLLKVPKLIIKNYEGRMLNIHPSLLPRFGGPGMYGDHVHNAVLSSNEKLSGITIHQVSEEYDKGDIVFQKRFPLDGEESLESLKSKIHSLEHENFPLVIEETIKKLKQ